MQVGCPRSVCRCAEDMAPTQVCCSCNLQLPSVHVTRRTALAETNGHESAEQRSTDTSRTLSHVDRPIPRT